MQTITGLQIKNEDHYGAHYYPGAEMQTMTSTRIKAEKEETGETQAKTQAQVQSWVKYEPQ